MEGEICLKCRRSGCDCDGCIDIVVLCENSFATCPCWRLKKCVKVCSNGTSGPKIKEKCRSIKQEDCDCPVDSDSNKGSEHFQCCEKVEVCVLRGDSISADYIITAEKFGEKKLFTIELKLHNRCSKCVEVKKVITLVQVKGSDGKWRSLSDDDSRQDICNFGVIQPGKSEKVFVAGGVDDSLVDESKKFRVAIKVITDVGCNTAFVPLPNFGCAKCSTKEWTVFDNGKPITNIDESKSICVCGNVYGPFGSDNCDRPIINVAKLVPKNISTNVTRQRAPPTRRSMPPAKATTTRTPPVPPQMMRVTQRLLTQRKKTMMPKALRMIFLLSTDAVSAMVSAAPRKAVRRGRMW